MFCYLLLSDSCEKGCFATQTSRPNSSLHCDYLIFHSNIFLPYCAEKWWKRRTKTCSGMRCLTERSGLGRLSKCIVFHLWLTLFCSSFSYTYCDSMASTAALALWLKTHINHCTWKEKFKFVLLRSSNSLHDEYHITADFYLGMDDIWFFANIQYADI